MTDEQASEHQLVAMVMPALAWREDKSGLTPPPDPLPLAARTALEWQKLAPHAVWAEVHGTAADVSHDRLNELIGRAAAAGEQLALAWSFLREADFWRNAPDDTDVAQSAMAVRAFTEVSRYFAVVTAHGVANCTVRTLMLEPTARALLEQKYPNAGSFAPFDRSPQAWLSCNADVASKLTEAADASGKGALQDLAASLGACVTDLRWMQLMDARHVDFHRWRAQSLEGGVPVQSAWTQPSPDSWQLTMYGSNPFPPPDPEESHAHSLAGLDCLSEMMDRWLTCWPAALEDAGVPVFKTS